jgi:protein TonB
VKFFPREEMPVYPGGDAAMAEFVSTHLEYPDVAKKLGIQGTVKVKFVVGTEGKVEDVGIAESENIVLNDAAMDVVRKLQKFKPAQQEGRLVKFSYILPIVFKIK